MYILSRRNIDKWPSWHLVWEWEDILSKETGWPITMDNAFLGQERVQRITPLTYLGLPKHYCFHYEMAVLPNNYSRRYNKNTFFPCIIDYFLKDNELSFFEKKYSNNLMVFISSKEVFDRLCQLGTKVTIRHLPLSLPDQYSLETTNVNKKMYDTVLVGRQNPVLKSYLNKYASKHPNFVYVYEDVTKGRKFHYYSSKGDYIGFFESRTKYMDLVSKSKIAFYSTPGIDGGEERTNGYNQVTPKFLEYLAAGCHIIARWKDNADTDYYHLGEFSDNIQTYEQFECAVDRALMGKPDIKKYSDYLKQHYTSNRINLLKDYLREVL